MRLGVQPLGGTDGRSGMGISMRQVVWCSATLSLGAFFYVLTMEPMDERRHPRAGAIERVPPRSTLVVNICRSLGQGQLGVADRQSEALLRNYPDDLDAIFFRAIVDRKLGREDLEGERWAMLDQQTRSLDEWPKRYSLSQIGYYRAWALVATGRVMEGQALFIELADQLEASAESDDQGGLVQYNLACYRAMGGQRDAAMELLASALENGYGQDNGWWMVDPDLESLWGEARFLEIGDELIARQNEANERDGRDGHDQRVKEPDKPAATGRSGQAEAGQVVE